MRLFRSWLAASVLLAASGSFTATWATEPTGSELARSARQAQKRGDPTNAYLLFAQAAAKDPKWWPMAEQLRREALKANPQLADQFLKIKGLEGPVQAPPLLPPPSWPDDMAALRPLAGPPTLDDYGTRQTFDFSDNVQYLYNQVATAFAMQATFDPELRVDQRFRLKLENVTVKEALRQLELATGTLVTPIDEHRFFVTTDTPASRLEHEANIAVAVPIPETVTVQEAQEVGTGLRAVFSLQRVYVDSNTRQVILRDAISKVRPAVAMLYQVLSARPEVVLELELIDLSQSDSTSFGLNVQSTYNLVNLAGDLTLGTAFGTSLFAVTLQGFQAMLNATHSESRTLFKAQLRASNGQPAQLNVGDKYPIITGFVTQQSNQSSYPPTVTFEDLGLTFKATPRIHGREDVTLEIDTEFKTLSGQTYNGIPSISDKKFVGQIRLRQNEWAVVGGVISLQDLTTVNSLSGFAQVPVLGPLLGSRTRTKTKSRLLILVKPTLVIAPPDASQSPELLVGTETRPLIPL